MKGLTARQTEVLDAIRDHCRRHHRAPTLRELARVLGEERPASTCTVQRHIEALERKGFLERTRHYAYRNIRLLDGTDPADIRAALDDVATACGELEEAVNPEGYPPTPGSAKPWPQWRALRSALVALRATGWEPNNNSQDREEARCA